MFFGWYPALRPVSPAICRRVFSLLITHAPCASVLYAFALHEGARKCLLSPGAHCTIRLLSASTKPSIPAGLEGATAIDLDVWLWT